MDLVNIAGFRQWLARRGLSDRSASDVCSRLNRLSRIIDIAPIKVPADLEVALIRTASFSELSVFVRSQLRRAGNLRLIFEGEQER